MDKEDIIWAIIYIAIFTTVATFMFSPLVHNKNEIEQTICSDDISSYYVDKDIIYFNMIDGSVIKATLNEAYVDFTVNSKLYINIYNEDDAYWFWDKPYYDDVWTIDNVIKVPDGD